MDIGAVVTARAGVGAGASIMVAGGETAEHPMQTRQSNKLMVLIVRLLSRVNVMDWEPVIFIHLVNFWVRSLR